jgi:thioredoxin-related protein
MSQKPIVDGIERDFAGRLVVLRVNIQEPLGRELQAAYQVEFTPTFILFDAEGEQIGKFVGAIDPNVVRRVIEDQ